jgi:hypothetical protein
VQKMPKWVGGGAMSFGSVCAVSTHRTGGLALVRRSLADDKTSRLVAWGGVAANVLSPPAYHTKSGSIIASAAAGPVHAEAPIASTNGSVSTASATIAANPTVGSTSTILNDWSMAIPASWGGVGRVVEPQTVLSAPWESHSPARPRWAAISAASESAAAVVTHKGDVWVWGYLQTAPPYPFTSNPPASANSTKQAFVLLSDPRTGASLTLPPTLIIL